MRKRSALHAISVLLLTLLFATLANAQTARDQVQKLFDDQTAAWNRGDLVAFMQGYEKAAGLTFFSGDTVFKGWQATLERYQARYQAKGREMGQLHFTDGQIDLLGPDAAMFTAHWHLLLHDGHKLEGLTTVICKRTEDGWKIIHDHSS